MINFLKPVDICCFNMLIYLMHGLSTTQTQQHIASRRASDVPPVESAGIFEVARNPDIIWSMPPAASQMEAFELNETS